MKLFSRYLFILLILIKIPATAQLLNKKQSFSRADSLRGTQTRFRTCYDINFYHLNVKVDADCKFISGSNLFKFTATQDFDTLQFDLFPNLKIEKVLYKGKNLHYRREFGAVFIEFPQTIQKGAKEEFSVYYSGHPLVTQKAPWEGGFIFTQDSGSKPWVAVACQGIGASLWWPNKDQQADEVDSMLISISCPQGLMDVSNGRLRSIQKQNNGYNQYNWFVSYPINNYDVTLNIADFAHFTDQYTGENGKLSLDYYVLNKHLKEARKQFEANVKPMLRCFEYWFGPYPFYRDGYKLVEAPYLGMEHQSAVAYGNDYQNGYQGRDLSGTGLGLDWDYIIIHESGHEWFGNSITAKDIADMWIHEAFTMYAEALFVECNKGKKAAEKYIVGLRRNIKNDIPIIGPYGVNKEGSGDMYYKGANMLQSIRTIINNDSTWRNILRGLNTQFGLKTVTTNDIVNYINKASGRNLTPIFDQYLKFAGIPVLEIRKDKKSLSYRWKADINNFNMPLRVKLPGNKNWQFINPETTWKTIKATSMEADTVNFYIKTKILSR